MPVDALFDPRQFGAFFQRDERVSHSFAAHPPGAADAMHVVVAELGHVKIDNVRNIGDVNSASHDIGGHQVPKRSGTKRLHDPVSASLLQVAVNAIDALDPLGEPLVGALRAAFGSAEDNRPLRLFAGEQAAEQVEFSAWIDRKIVLIDRFDGNVVRRKVERLRLEHVAPREPFDGRRHGGAKQQRLSLARTTTENFLDVGPKTDIQHPIGFVKYDTPDFIQFQCVAANMVQHAARRADDHLCSTLQFLDLAADWLAAINGDATDAAAMG